MGVNINNNRKEVHSILEIRMGKGVKPNEDSYGAQDVVDDLSESHFFNGWVDGEILH